MRPSACALGGSCASTGISGTLMPGLRLLQIKLNLDENVLPGAMRAVLLANEEF